VINAICGDIEAADRQGKSRDLFRKVKVITGKFTPRNKSITGREVIKVKWRSYTEELYKKDTKLTTTFTGTGYELEPGITQGEVEKALHGNKNIMSPGTDDIPIELIKWAGEEGAKVLTTGGQKVGETGIDLGMEIT